MSTIKPIASPVVPASSASSAAASAADGGAGFGASLQQLMTAVESSTTDANAAVGRMVDGTGDVHEAMIALQQADLALQLTVQIRNKLVQAYQEIMRMPV